MPAKILIVYFSHTGNTKEIAEAIASEVSADIEQIGDNVKRTGFFGYLKTCVDALFRRGVPIRPPVYNPARYDLVILGTPVWAWSLSSPVRAYITEHFSEFGNVAFFCTEGGAGGAGVFRQMAKLCGKQAVATLEITETEMKNNTDKQKLKPFIQTISKYTAGG